MERASRWSKLTSFRNAAEPQAVRLFLCGRSTASPRSPRRVKVPCTSGPQHRARLPCRSITCCPTSAPSHSVIEEFHITSIPLPTLRSLVRGPWPSIVLATLAFCLLWLDLFSLPASPVTPELDLSWSGALIHFSAQGLQFGKDVVFTHGPLGHLTAFVYTGELFSVRVIWEFVSKTLFAAILCAAMVRLPMLWRPIFLSFVLLFIWADGVSDALYFLIISCLAALLFKHGNSSRTLNILAGGLFAVFSLIKFTYFLLVILAVALISACYCKQRRPMQALLLGLIFLFTFILCWGFAGQQYGHLVSYITTSMDISFGYREAMGLPANRPAILLAGITAALLGLIQCALIVLDSRKLPALFVALFFGGVTFLSWNRAFIRADDHVLSFFALCPVALLTIWIVVRPKQWSAMLVTRLTSLFLPSVFWGFRCKDRGHSLLALAVRSGGPKTPGRSSRIWARLRRSSELS